MDRQIRLIGIDLDGTLLTRQKELTAASRRALTDAIRAGIEVVPVTGRPLAGVPREVLDIPGIRYVITSNGANTYDLSRGTGDGDRGELILKGTLGGRTPGTVLRKAHLSHDTVKRILQAAPGEDVIREIFVKGVGYHDPRTQTMLPGSHVENISLMFPSQEQRDAAFARLKKIRGNDGERMLHILVPYYTDLEITHVQADKWRSLEDLGRHLGITDEEIMTLGDGDNDRPMLRGAGLSVAMGNAPDYVKETADRVTLDNEHDGAAEAIRGILGL